MTTFRLLAALAAFALPAAAVAEAPGAYDRGVEARLAGRTAEAVDLLGQAASAEPANADAQLQYGLALLAADRLDDAERALRAALAIAPGYDDARIALARLYDRRGDRTAALAELAPVGPSNSDAAALRTHLSGEAATVPAYRWQADFDASYSDLDGASDWQDFALRIAGWASPATRIGIGLEQSHRFGRDDTYGEVRVEQRVGDQATLWLYAGGTPDADFRPRWQVGGGGAFKLSQGPSATVATIEARHSRYPTGNVDMISPGLEQYLPGGHWLTARMINVVEGGQWRTGWLARADVMAAPRLRLFGGLSDAPDVTEGVVVDTFAVFGGAAFDVTDRVNLRLSVNREDRQGSADRLEVATGLGLRF
ncbi:YaiO family outer membrane beta-barrel protein [Sphingomonas sabuli]|uniref:YaiO family outer membrane beta-barrel protein n=1 Tax=Sphingomonas sabuli TaxID=2764186 RepID=A0A7G9L1J1_9SPHN|nr:YaiO family outer membrane beta-barrel protein [Sphingomonas sabuli]QNM82490.1 YaiO family outer membrane beta-barrel protein [Sphingomonas sabuli]